MNDPNKFIPLPRWVYIVGFIVNLPSGIIGLIALLLTKIFQGVASGLEWVTDLSFEIKSAVRQWMFALASRNTKGQTAEQVTEQLRQREESRKATHELLKGLPQLTEDSGKIEVKQWHYEADCPAKKRIVDVEI